MELPSRYESTSGPLTTTARFRNPSVLERLALIAVGHAAGLSLDEIALMFAPDGRPRIDRLTDMRDGLRHAAACRAPSHMECPPFGAFCGPPLLELLDHEGKRVLIVL